MNEAVLAPCDRGIADGKAGAAVAHPRLVLATTILASSLAFVDGSVVNVGLPAIARSFPADAGSLSWVVAAYLLPLSALLLIGGAAGDRYGHRRLLLLGIGLFLAASLLCAAAPGLYWLLAGRILQGVGAAMLMPTSLAILGTSFSGAARGRAIGIWAAIGAAAGAIGPLIGGWLIDLAGWRAIFLLNLPIGAAAMWLGARYVTDRPSANPAPLDWPGACLVTAGLAALTWGLTLASSQQGAPAAAWSIVAVGAVLLALFLRCEQRRGAQAMMPLSLFSSRAFVGLNILTFLLYGALGGMLVLLPYLLIELKGYSATQAGAALLPMPLLIALTAPTMGKLAASFGARLPLTIGPAVVAVGFLLAMRIGAADNYWTATLPAMLTISLGMAGAVAPLTSAVLGAVDARHTGMASGFNSAVARTGGLIATAMSSAILVAHAQQLQSSFHVAMAVCAASAAAASACAFLWLAPKD
ncbi:MFS transporter [Massilia sp. S19_KUP03_FR1]|uniref:MFS transporter n=1 Tax=Massilia sp. S19_KUP03_FR1 TaxID=3025503 RepID=UPI002FCD6E2F